nr:xyloside xylosyltransferase 1 isoform X2 [Ovis aries]
MLKLDAGSCKTRVLSRLSLSGRMGDWGRLDAVGHLFLGSPPQVLLADSTLLLWEILVDFVATAASQAAPRARGRGVVAPSGLAQVASVEWQAAAGLHLRSLPQSWEERGLLPEAEVSQVVFHDVGVLTDKLFPVVEAMQKHFSAGSGTYYSDSIFFLSVAMHQIMPKEILRIIQLDLDLKYKTNIRELFEEFDNFLPGAIIGIAREMQPVYRHTFWQFRHDNPKTRVGSPPPEGLPGFNSGVMLLNLEAMRQSPLYDRLLEPAQVQQLADKYHFRGHLGDQDFFTMIGMEHPELFHVLDCTWNRQLCTWWRDHGYSDVFDAYFRCEGHVKIYHGNCNTPIPEA